MRQYFSLLVIALCLSTHALYAAPFEYGMVVSESRVASEAGAEILKAGGNAIDAAVAVGYVLAVVKPCCGNIGGGGFMTIHFANGKNTFLNFREKAPAAAHPNMYKGKALKSQLGFLAVGVPGTVLGFDTALKRYGSMSRAQVMARAIALAENGYEVTPYDSQQFYEMANLFKEQTNVAAIFLNNGKVYQPGQRLVQKDLAHSLRLIAKQGPAVFYQGSIAKEIVKASQENGGILSLDDFKHYTVQEINPIFCTYRGFQIVSAPPPSSGGVTLCEILNILENFPLKKFGQKSLKSTQTIIEAMRYGFIDRNTKLGDPDFVSNPIDKLLSKNYAKKMSETIWHTKRAPKTFAPKFHPEMTDTTHYSVMDKYGNAVAVTYTLNGFFGAGVIAGDTGFFLNNEMDDFSISPSTANKFNLVQSQANAIQPKKRPLSSMSPTIVLKDGKVFMVLGSPGGPRIITSVLLTILNTIDFEMPLQKAINKPRYHYQANPDSIDVEPFSISFILRHQLELLGYHVLPQNTWGALEAIQIPLGTAQMQGAADIRRPDGAAIKAH